MPHTRAHTRTRTARTCGERTDGRTDARKHRPVGRNLRSTWFLVNHLVSGFEYNTGFRQALVDPRRSPTSHPPLARFAVCREISCGQRKTINSAACIMSRVRACVENNKMENQTNWEKNNSLCYRVFGVRSLCDAEQRMLLLIAIRTHKRHERTRSDRNWGQVLIIWLCWRRRTYYVCPCA